MKKILIESNLKVDEQGNNPFAGAFIQQQTAFFLRRQVCPINQLMNNPKPKGRDLFVLLFCHKNLLVCVFHLRMMISWKCKKLTSVGSMKNETLQRAAHRYLPHAQKLIEGQYQIRAHSEKRHRLALQRRKPMALTGSGKKTRPPAT